MSEPRRELPPGYQEQLDLGYVFGGLSTFAQRPFVPHAAHLAEWKPDVAVMGAPVDLGTTNRPGARFGPRAVRTQAYEPGTFHLDLGIEIFEHLEVVDAGDAFCPHGRVEQSLDNVKAKVAEIVNLGITPIVIGGDTPSPGHLQLQLQRNTASGKWAWCISMRMQTLPTPLTEIWRVTELQCAGLLRVVQSLHTTLCKWDYAGTGLVKTCGTGWQRKA